MQGGGRGGGAGGGEAVAFALSERIRSLLNTVDEGDGIFDEFVLERVEDDVAFVVRSLRAAPHDALVQTTGLWAILRISEWLPAATPILVALGAAEVVQDALRTFGLSNSSIRDTCMRLAELLDDDDMPGDVVDFGDAIFDDLAVGAPPPSDDHASRRAPYPTRQWQQRQQTRQQPWGYPGGPGHSRMQQPHPMAMADMRAGDGSSSSSGGVGGGAGSGGGGRRRRRPGTAGDVGPTIPPMPRLQPYQMSSENRHLVQRIFDPPTSMPKEFRAALRQEPSPPLEGLRGNAFLADDRQRPSTADGGSGGPFAVHSQMHTPGLLSPHSLTYQELWGDMHAGSQPSNANTSANNYRMDDKFEAPLNHIAQDRSAPITTTATDQAGLEEAEAGAVDPAEGEDEDARPTWNGRAFEWSGASEPPLAQPAHSGYYANTFEPVDNTLPPERDSAETEAVPGEHRVRFQFDANSASDDRNDEGHGLPRDPILSPIHSNKDPAQLERQQRLSQALRKEKVAMLKSPPSAMERASVLMRMALRPLELDKKNQPYRQPRENLVAKELADARIVGEGSLVPGDEQQAAGGVGGPVATSPDSPGSRSAKLAAASEAHSRMAASWTQDFGTLRTAKDINESNELMTLVTMDDVSTVASVSTVDDTTTAGGDGDAVHARGKHAREKSTQGPTFVDNAMRDGVQLISPEKLSSHATLFTADVRGDRFARGFPLGQDRARRQEGKQQQPSQTQPYDLQTPSLVPPTPDDGSLQYSPSTPGGGEVGGSPAAFPIRTGNGDINGRLQEGTDEYVTEPFEETDPLDLLRVSDNTIVPGRGGEAASGLVPKSGAPDAASTEASSGNSSARSPSRRGRTRKQRVEAMLRNPTLLQLFEKLVDERDELQEALSERKEGSAASLSRIRSRWGVFGGGTSKKKKKKGKKHKAVGPGRAMSPPRGRARSPIAAPLPGTTTPTTTAKKKKSTKKARSVGAVMLARGAKAAQRERQAGGASDARPKARGRPGQRGLKQPWEYETEDEYREAYGLDDCPSSEHGDGGGFGHTGGGAHHRAGGVDAADEQDEEVRLRSLLTRRRAIRDLEQIFGLIDSKGTGFVSAQTFRQVLTSLGLHITSGDVNEVFNHFKVDEDAQKINYHEFCTSAKMIALADTDRKETYVCTKGWLDFMKKRKAAAERAKHAGREVKPPTLTWEGYVGWYTNRRAEAMIWLLRRGARGLQHEVQLEHAKQYLRGVAKRALACEDLLNYGRSAIETAKRMDEARKRLWGKADHARKLRIKHRETQRLLTMDGAVALARQAEAEAAALEQRQQERAKRFSAAPRPAARRVYGSLSADRVWELHYHKNEAFKFLRGRAELAYAKFARQADASDWLRNYVRGVFAQEAVIAQTQEWLEFKGAQAKKFCEKRYLAQVLLVRRAERAEFHLRRRADAIEWMHERGARACKYVVVRKAAADWLLEKGQAMLEKVLRKADAQTFLLDKGRKAVRLANAQEEAYTYLTNVVRRTAFREEYVHDSAAFLRQVGTYAKRNALRRDRAFIALRATAQRAGRVNKLQVRAQLDLEQFAQAAKEKLWANAFLKKNRQRLLNEMSRVASEDRKRARQRKKLPFEEALVEELLVLFDVLDKDRNCRLDRVEFRLLTRDAKLSDMSAEALDDAFDDMDSGHRGYATFQQLFRWYKREIQRNPKKVKWYCEQLVPVRDRAIHRLMRKHQQQEQTRDAGEMQAEDERWKEAMRREVLNLRADHADRQSPQKMLTESPIKATQANLDSSDPLDGPVLRAPTDAPSPTPPSHADAGEDANDGKADEEKPNAADVDESHPEPAEETPNGSAEPKEKEDEKQNADDDEMVVTG